MIKYKLTLNSDEEIDVYSDGVDIQESGAVNFYNRERVDEYVSYKHTVRAFGPQHWKEVKKATC
jgi:hypothetical protein